MRLLDKTKTEHELDEAERKAWDSLSRYKFMMFGYWAAIWVHLNRVGECNRSNPWRGLVKHAGVVMLGFVPQGRRQRSTEATDE